MSLSATTKDQNYQYGKVVKYFSLQFVQGVEGLITCVPLSLRRAPGFSGQCLSGYSMS